MKLTVCAGAIAFAIAGSLATLPASVAKEFTAASSDSSPMSAEINIGRIRSVLRLTAEQEPYWPPVEAALRGLARQQAKSEPAGYVRRISNRIVSIVLNGAAVERLAVAARPLIAVLNQEQMRAASGLAQEMGLGAVVMAALR